MPKSVLDADAAGSIDRSSASGDVATGADAAAACVADAAVDAAAAGAATASAGCIDSTAGNAAASRGVAAAARGRRKRVDDGEGAGDAGRVAATGEAGTVRTCTLDGAEEGTGAEAIDPDTPSHSAACISSTSAVTASSGRQRRKRVSGGAEACIDNRQFGMQPGGQPQGRT